MLDIWIIDQKKKPENIANWIDICEKVRFSLKPQFINIKKNVRFLIIIPIW